MKMISNNLFFIMRFMWGILLDFFFDKYDATENHTWGGKDSIILNLRNDINISDGNNISMIRGIMKEFLLAKVDGVKFKPDLKGQIKNGRKSIIGMDSKEAQIIADVVELGMSTLTAWSLVKDCREVK